MTEHLQIDTDLSIPQSELSFRFSRSSGPGGQHVQKSDTRVELLFDVARSPSLTDAQRTRILTKLSRYVDSDGILHLVDQSERSQKRNRDRVVARFQSLVKQALKRRRRRKATRPSAASRERRLQKKKHHSQKKSRRKKVSRDQE